MHRICKLLLVLSVAFSFQSCAAMFSGTSDEIAFTSEPSGAEVVVAGHSVGTTPCSAKVDKGIDDVVFKDATLGERKVHLDSSFQFGFLLLDVLFTPGFGASGVLGDLITQGWWDHPAIVHCDFTKQPPAEREEPPANADDLSASH